MLEHVGIYQMTLHHTALYKVNYNHTKGYHSDLVQLCSGLLWNNCPNKSKIVQIPVFKIHVCILASSKNGSM